jgi:hypothetical protein
MSRPFVRLVVFNPVFFKVFWGLGAMNHCGSSYKIYSTSSSPSLCTCSRRCPTDNLLCRFQISKNLGSNGVHLLRRHFSDSPPSKRWMWCCLADAQVIRLRLHIKIELQNYRVVCTHSIGLIHQAHLHELPTASVRRQRRSRGQLCTFVKPPELQLQIGVCCSRSRDYFCSKCVLPCCILY